MLVDRPHSNQYAEDTAHSYTCSGKFRGGHTDRVDILWLDCDQAPALTSHTWSATP